MTTRSEKLLLLGTFHFLGLFRSLCAGGRLFASCGKQSGQSGEVIGRHGHDQLRPGAFKADVTGLGKWGRILRHLRRRCWR